MSYLYCNLSNIGNTDMGEGEESCGRILTSYEYLMQLQSRPDIFISDRDFFLKKAEVCCFVIACVVGIFLFNAEQNIRVTTDMIAPPVISGNYERGIVQVLNKPVEVIRNVASKMVERPVKLIPRQATVGTVTRSISGSTGGGSYTARIMKKGVLGYMGNFVFGKDVHGDIFGKGGRPSDNMDAFLSGKDGIGKGYSSAGDRRGPAVIGFGNGISGGIGGGNEGGPGGIEDLMRADYVPLQIKGQGKERGRSLSGDIKTSTTIRTGGRNRNSILRVVQQNLASLRYAYNLRLREKPGLKGRVSVRFAIDEFGRVIFCEVAGSSMYDGDFENSVVSKIKTWVFEKIDMPGDVTEVVYPFVFSM